MALITNQAKFVHPQAYFGVCHGHLPGLKLLSGTPSAQVENWSKINADVNVTKIDPTNNTVELSNGTSYTYKALVLAPGFNHTSDNLKGLPEFEAQKP